MKNLLITETDETFQKLKQQVQAMAGETDEAKCAAYIGSITSHPLFIKFRDNLISIMVEQIGLSEQQAGGYASGSAISFLMKFLLEKTDAELLELVNRVVIAANTPDAVKNAGGHLGSKARKAFKKMTEAQEKFLIIFGDLFKDLTNYDDFIRKQED